MLVVLSVRHDKHPNFVLYRVCEKSVDAKATKEPTDKRKNVVCQFFALMGIVDLILAFSILVSCISMHTLGSLKVGRLPSKRDVVYSNPVCGI